jgi:hypothetical protein
MADDFEFFVGQLPNNGAPGPLVPFEFLLHAPSSVKETIRACVNGTLTGQSSVSWMG